MVVQGRNDIVIHEVFRCLDEDGQSRPFTYHLGRADYGCALWTLTTKFEFRNLSPYGHAMGPHHKEDLAIIVVYDSREDGIPDDLPLVEARVMEILSGARKHIAHDGTVHWGPYTIVQDLANQRFAIDHRQPYSGGGQGQVEIVVGPQSDGVGRRAVARHEPHQLQRSADVVHLQHGAGASAPPEVGGGEARRCPTIECRPSPVHGRGDVDHRDLPGSRHRLSLLCQKCVRPLGTIGCHWEQIQTEVPA